MSFAPSKLKALREKRGFTQEQLAEASGMDRANLARLEGGRRKNPSSDTL